MVEGSIPAAERIGAAPAGSDAGSRRMAIARAVTAGDFDAVLFGLHGVLTTTRPVYVAAWKQTFDEFLGGWDARYGTVTAPFDERLDYATPCRRQAASGRAAL
jgi:hypothetical protein